MTTEGWPERYNSLGSEDGGRDRSLAAPRSCKGKKGTPLESLKGIDP